MKHPGSSQPITNQFLFHCRYRRHSRKIAGDRVINYPEQHELSDPGQSDYRDFSMRHAKILDDVEDQIRLIVDAL